MDSKTPLDLVIDQLANYHLIDAHEPTKRAHVKQILEDGGYVAEKEAPAEPERGEDADTEPPSVQEELVEQGGFKTLESEAPVADPEAV